MSEESLAEGLGESGDEPVWSWTDGVAGEGDAPEWFLGDKYKSVEGQAKAYVDLQSKFGAFTGAPKVEGDQAHGYSLEGFVPEGVDLGEAGIPEDDQFINSFLPMFQELNVNQESVDKLAQRYFSIQADALQAQDAYKAGQMQELGPNADARITNIIDYAKAQLDEGEQKALIDGLTSAAAVKAVEKLISKAKGTRLAESGDANTPTVTMAEIRELQMATDEHGNRLMQDKDYAAMVRAKAAQVVGE